MDELLGSKESLRARQGALKWNKVLRDILLLISHLAFMQPTEGRGVRPGLSLAVRPRVGCI